MNTTDNNKLIAEFLGYSQPHPSYPNATYWYKEGREPLTILLFHTDWNWLMQVVDNIESLDHWIEIAGGIENICLIGSINSSCESFKTVAETKIEAVYNACVEFIKMYNEQK